VIFKSDDIVAGGISYDDVPKYLGAIHQFRVNGAHEMAESILNKMLELGHPAAMAQKAEDLILKGETNYPEAVKLLEKGVAMDDEESLFKYGTWILRGTVSQDKISDGLDMLKRLAEKGFPHLVTAAPAYYLKQIVLGVDHKVSNEKLNYWLKIWDPKGYKQYQKGKISQKDFLAPVAREAGVEWKG
jgi:TPR repeat protein